MDKSWIQTHIKSLTFKDGVQTFIDFARINSIRGSILCPCRKCCNSKWFSLVTVHAHLLQYGFLPGYTSWTFHGEHVAPSNLSHSSIVQEQPFGQDNIRGLLQDALGVSSLPFDNQQEMDYVVDDDNSEPDQNVDHGVMGDAYNKLIEKCEKELYPGCKYSTLSFTLHLYRIKCIGGTSDKAFGADPKNNKMDKIDRSGSRRSIGNRLKRCSNS